MKRQILLLVGCAWVLLASGCAMCSSPFDYDYAAYGGKHDRVDRCRGRVGSAFEPAEGRLVPAPAEEAIAPGDPESPPMPPIDEP